MADAVTTQVLLDGPRNVVMKFTNISDGVGEAAVTKADLTTLAKGPRGESLTGLVIDRVEFDTHTMALDVLWDAATPQLAFSIPKDHNGSLDWTDVGGLHNNAGAGKNGNIKFTTIGAAAGARYAVTLFLRKQYLLAL